MINMKRSNKDHDANFTCGNNSNFQMNINGFRISIAFGPGCHVSDRDIRMGVDFDTPSKHLLWGSDDAEVLIWNRNGDPIIWDSTGNQTIGCCKPDQVAQFIALLANCPPVNFDPTDGLRKIHNAF